MWAFEQKAVLNGFFCVAGVDEAGRGPLAGPVVAGAVVLPEGFEAGEINDSKKLTPKKRDTLFGVIKEDALSVGIGIVDAEEIDAINILQASLKAMKLAVGQLVPQPDYLLVDGNFKVPMMVAQEPIKKGDSRSVSIAAASIIAKVSRDRMMAEYDGLYPGYGFVRHQGYPTKAHREAISKLGPCPIHRRTFKGVSEHCRPSVFF